MFSPIVKYSSIRMLLDMVALFYLEWDQFDFKTAFLNGELNVIGGGSIWRPLKGVEAK